MKIKVTATILLALIANWALAQQDSTNNSLELLMLQGNGSNTIPLLKKRAANDTTNAQNQLLLGYAYNALTQYDSAAIAFSKACKIDTTSSIAKQELAGALLSFGRITQSIKTYNEAIALDSTNRYAKIELARLLKRENQFKKSRAIWEDLLKADSTNYFIWEQIGDCYYKDNDANSAWACYFMSHYNNPSNLPIAVKIGQIGNISGAPFDLWESIIDTALTFDTTYVPLLRTKAYTEFRKEQYASASKWFSKAFELGDSTRFTLKHYGITEYHNGLFYKSAGLMEAAYKIDTTDIPLNFVLAKALRKIGDRPMAIKLLQNNTLLMNPDKNELAMMYEEMGYLYKENKEPKLAIEKYLKAINITPSRFYLLYNVAYCQELIDEPKNALRSYQNYITLYEDTITSDSTKLANKPTIEYAQFRVKKIREKLFFQDNLIADSAMVDPKNFSYKQIDGKFTLMYNGKPASDSLKQEYYLMQRTIPR
ncbi:MAG: hypothetical protein JW783_12875 [Bacteroidales bacterium]|nr:hypothetical protein [Bacteroidales bacterium]MBN2749308.1 hypothetical protein [Bacteroidales bacterium]